MIVEDYSLEMSRLTELIDVVRPDDGQRNDKGLSGEEKLRVSNIGS